MVYSLFECIKGSVKKTAIKDDVFLFVLKNLLVLGLVWFPHLSPFSIWFAMFIIEPSPHVNSFTSPP